MTLEIDPLSWGKPNVGTQDVKTLDHGLIGDLSSAQALQLISNGLVTLDPSTLKVVPDMASSWDTPADGKTWTFHLRPGLKFSNGDPLTASDFASSIDRAFDPSLDGKSGTASYHLGISDVTNIVGAPDRAAGKMPTIIGTGVVAVNDLKRRVTAYNQAEEIAVDEVAWIPIFQSKNIYVFQKYVKGFRCDAQGLSPDILWPNVQILAQ